MNSDPESQVLVRRHERFKRPPRCEDQEQYSAAAVALGTVGGSRASAETS
jgi:hypothetical protein